MRNKGLTLANTTFNGISKIHPSHSFTYTITKAATCTTSGTKTGTCTCGNTDTQSISATGHSYGDWVVSSDESTKIRTCSKCGNKETTTVTKVELKDANAATKSKYNFKCIENTAHYVDYGGGSTTTSSGADFYNIFEYITPSSCPVKSIVYINSIDTDINTNNRTIIYAINESNTTIPAGYYKIKAICNRSETLYNSVEYDNGACNLIPFAMGSAGGSRNGYGESSSSDIKAELSKYIEYLGTSYKVVSA